MKQTDLQKENKKIEANQFYLDYLCGYINCYSII